MVARGRLHPPPSALLPHPTVIDLALAMYFRPETGGLTLIGLEDGSQFGRSPDNSTDYVSAGLVERAVDRICRRVPA